MKDSLFELLLDLFQKTITQLKEEQTPAQQQILQTTPELDAILPNKDTNPKVVSIKIEQLKLASDTSLRVFTPYERTKLTKASYQFLVRMASWGIISSETMELILNRLIFSDSRYISLQETKWTVRQALAHGLSPEQLSFLDLVLYQQEDKHLLH